MTDIAFTPAEYAYVTNARTNQVRALLIEAFQDCVPSGYVLSVDPNKMYGNSLIVLRPAQATKGMKMVCFLYAINYRNSIADGKAMYRPTVESVRACGDEKGAANWKSDTNFGKDGRIEVCSADVGDLPALVRTLAAQVCSFAPFTAFEWRRCAHDDFGKWELFDGERNLQSVWKSGRHYATLMGTCPKTLDAAKAEAEAAARFTIFCEHQERLAGLGQQSADVEEHTGEESGAPSM